MDIISMYQDLDIALQRLKSTHSALARTILETKKKRFLRLIEGKEWVAVSWNNLYYSMTCILTAEEEEWVVSKLTDAPALEKVYLNEEAGIYYQIHVTGTITIGNVISKTNLDDVSRSLHEDYGLNIRGTYV